MSVDAPSKTKEKKAQRDAERHRKGRKRKHEDTLDVPEGAEEDAAEHIPITAGDDVEKAAPAVKAPKTKKRKHSEDAASATPTTTDPDAPADDADAAAKRKARTLSRNLRKRKKEKAAKLDGRQPADVDADPTTTTTTAADGAVDPATGEKASKSRFILFIGNLPFATTDAALHAYFKRLMPFTLRHRTDPKSQKSKGFAFLEFENFDRMETCLKKYHHTLFDPDDYCGEVGKFGERSGQQAKRNKGKSKGRLINVELTAGGGGSGGERMEKIREKNGVLEEERARRAEAEAKEEAEAAKKGGKRVTKKAPVVSGVNAEGVHPSRLAMLKNR